MPLFGTAHLLILLAIFSTAAVLAWITTRFRAAARRVRFTIGFVLAANEIAWYAFRYAQEGLRFPEGLPLELCDIVVWLAVFACFRTNATATEFVYFAGMGGSIMALLSPDLWAPLASYPTVYFFLGHGGVAIAASVLVFGGQVRLRRWAALHVFVALNLYAAAIGTFNLYFHTNYFYLCDKPESRSILDWFGPWPVYIGVAELFALGMFAVMAVPVRWRFGQVARYLPAQRKGAD